MSFQNVYVRGVNILLTSFLTIGSKAWAETETTQAEPSKIAGKIKAEARIRYENVSDDAKRRDANATTMRVRLGYESKKMDGFQGYIEGQANVGSGDYNTTLNGRTNYPVVVDPNKTNIHQLYVSYDQLGESFIRLGRQEILWDNQRFIGNVGWRQLAQTFDSVVLNKNLAEDIHLDMGYIGRVIDIRGQDQTMSTPMFHLEYDGNSYGSIVAYGYLIDYDEAAYFNKSNRTLGARFSGSREITERTKLIYTAEYAKQSDYRENPVKYDANYVLGEVGAQLEKWSGRIGYEVLGADRDANIGFMTPLATLHKFQGWADKFLSTPAGGVEDTYLSLETTTLPYDIKSMIVAHDFKSNVGPGHYGKELDLSFSKSISDGALKGTVFLFKMARYKAVDFSTDANKTILEITKKF